MRGNADACEEAFAETQSGISKLAASSSASICDVRQRVSEFVAQSEGEAEMENSTAEEDPLAGQPAKYTTLDFSVLEGLSQESAAHPSGKPTEAPHHQWQSYCTGSSATN